MPRDVRPCRPAQRSGDASLHGFAHRGCVRRRVLEDGDDDEGGGAAAGEGGAPADDGEGEPSEALRAQLRAMRDELAALRAGGTKVLMPASAQCA